MKTQGSARFGRPFPLSGEGRLFCARGGGEGLDRRTVLIKIKTER
nr:MAG TPA: hypothetical protein [Caudoviricetes sp.]